MLCSCAATKLEIAKDLAAVEGEMIDPEASERIRRDCYVDDGLTGGSPEQVSRFMGEKSENSVYDGTIPQILSKANFNQSYDI